MLPVVVELLLPSVAERLAFLPLNRLVLEAVALSDAYWKPARKRNAKEVMAVGFHQSSCDDISGC